MEFSGILTKILSHFPRNMIVEKRGKIPYLEHTGIYLQNMYAYKFTFIKHMQQLLWKTPAKSLL